MKVKKAELHRALNIQKQPLPDSLSGSERGVGKLAAAGFSSK